MDNGFMAGAIAARRHDLPSVLFSVSPLAISSKDTAPFGMGLQPPRTGLDGLRYALLDWFTRTVVFRDVQKAAERIVADAGQPVPDGFFLDWVQTGVTRVLHPSIPSFEYPRSDLPEHVELVGPYLPAGIDRFDPPAWWDDVLEARATGVPVVLVTQGTVATDPERLLWPAIDGLADEDVLVVATTEPLDAYPANVRAASVRAVRPAAAARRRPGHQRRLRRGPAGARRGRARRRRRSVRGQGRGRCAGGLVRRRSGAAHRQGHGRHDVAGRPRRA